MTASAYHFNLGLEYLAQGKLDNAVASFRDVLVLEPQSANAHCALGNLLRIQGKLDDAVAHSRKAIELQPGFAGAHNNLGLALAAQGKLDEAVSQYQLAIRFDPAYAEPHNNMGLVLASQANAQPGKIDKAIACYRKALVLKPNYPNAFYNMGVAHMEQGRWPEASTCFQHVVRLMPDHVDALNNLGIVLMELGHLAEAADCVLRALHIKPDFAEGHCNLGCVRERQFQYQHALDCYQEALRRKPSYAKAQSNLGNVHQSLGETAAALACYRKALELQPDMQLTQSNLLFCLTCDPDADPDDVFAEHRRWGRLQQQHAICLPHANDPAPKRRLRIGYVSPDLRRHALTRYFEQVLANHDPKKVEVFCYAEVRSPDPVTKRLQSLSHGWHSTCRQTDEQVAQQIYNDHIDILVDLAGHTANSRLRVFAFKPAPVQATWLGYMNTTGLTTVDYRLTDEFLDPPGQPVRDTEDLLPLRAGMCCFTPGADAPAVAPLPALQRGYLTFGSLHNLYKVNAKVLDLWSEVLKALPTARLLMFRDTLTPPAQECIRRHFSERGIAAERLDLRQGSAAPGSLGIYSEIDVALDTFPCTGGVTTCEALWMGVPVVSLAGVRPASRNSAALLARAGLHDWVAQTPAEYVTKAARLQNSLDQLAELRSHLRDRLKPALCDARRFTRALEDAYRKMWRRWCARQTG